LLLLLQSMFIYVWYVEKNSGISICVFSFAENPINLRKIARTKANCTTSDGTG
jgi:hypothetical protein